METKDIVPFFTVIIPTLNEQYHLPLLLQDLSKQTFSDFDVIVVDAKSKDTTRLKAEKFKEKFQKLSILVSKKKNVCFQRNLGAKEASSNWLIFMDADNRIPAYLLQGLKFYVEMLNPDILSTWIMPDTNDRKDKAIATLVNIFMDAQKATSRPYVLESMLVARKFAFEKLIGFDEHLKWGEGSDMARRAIKRKMKLFLLKEPRYLYSFRRLRKQGTLRTIRNLAQIEIMRFMDKKTTEKKFEKLYPMEGGSYFIIDKKNKGRIEKLFSMLIQKTKTQIKNGNDTIIFKVIKKLMNRN